MVALSWIVKELEARQDPTLEFIRKTRPYKIPKGYISWRILSMVVAMSVDSIRQPEVRSYDLARVLNFQRTALWFVQNAPMYLISTELLRAFQASDVLDQKGILADLRPPMPTLMLLFPENSIKTPDGNYLNYCVLHIADRAHPERSEGSAYGLKLVYLEHEHEKNLHWSGVDDFETVWFSGFGLEDDGSIKTSDDSLGESEINQREREFLRDMRSLILQVLLTLTYRPDLMEQPAEQPAAARRGYKARQSGQPSVMQPRWLGKNYKRPSAIGKGSHASPHSHWRKAHWRRVVVGARELNQRRWHWFEPTFVKGS